MQRTSYVGAIRATTATLLLGGKRIHRSSRFATRAQAEAWCKTAQEINERAGRSAKTYVWGSFGPPEISAKGFNLAPSNQSREIS